MARKKKRSSQKRQKKLLQRRRQSNERQKQEQLAKQEEKNFEKLVRERFRLSRKYQKEFLGAKNCNVIELVQDRELREFFEKFINLNKKMAPQFPRLLDLYFEGKYYSFFEEASDYCFKDPSNELLICVLLNTMETFNMLAHQYRLVRDFQEKRILEKTSVEGYPKELLEYLQAFRDEDCLVEESDEEVFALIYQEEKFRALMAGKQCDEAKKVLEALEKERPDQMLVVYEWTIYYQISGQIEKSYSQYQKLYALACQHVEKGFQTDWGLRSLSLMIQQDFAFGREEAMKEGCAKLLQIIGDWQDHERNIQLGRALALALSPEEALEHFDGITADHDDELIYMKAVFLHQTGQKDEALELIGQRRYFWSEAIQNLLANLTMDSELNPLPVPLEDLLSFQEPSFPEAVKRLEGDSDYREEFVQEYKGRKDLLHLLEICVFRDGVSMDYWIALLALAPELGEKCLLEALENPKISRQRKLSLLMGTQIFANEHYKLKQDWMEHLLQFCPPMEQIVMLHLPDSRWFYSDLNPRVRLALKSEWQILEHQKMEWAFLDKAYISENWMKRERELPHLFMEQKFEEAKEFCAEMMEQYPEYLAVQCNYAQALIGLGELEEAKLYLADLIERNEYYYLPHEFFGLFLLQEGKIDEAIDYLNEKICDETDAVEFKMAGILEALLLLEQRDERALKRAKYICLELARYYVPDTAIINLWYRICQRA